MISYHIILYDSPLYILRTSTLCKSILYPGMPDFEHSDCVQCLCQIALIALGLPRYLFDVHSQLATEVCKSLVKFVI